MSFNSKIRAVFFASTLVALIPVAGFAGDRAQLTVKFSDLDVSTPAGAKVLYGRIAKAAEAVCPIGVSPAFADRAHRLCVEKAMSDAITGVNAPLLSKLYADHGGHVTGMTVAEAKLANN